MHIFLFVLFCIISKVDLKLACQLDGNVASVTRETKKFRAGAVSEEAAVWCPSVSMEDQLLLEENL